MFKFFHKLFNPHCPDCAEQERENRICASCETLKTENARLSNENLRLLEVLLRKASGQDIESEGSTETLRPLPVTNKHIPWNVRRQMLEAEDKARAKIIQNNPILDTKERTEDLEDEILKGAT
jgi:hypothetical protein